MKSKKTGVLLINVGSPQSPQVPEVKQYLREFLSDPRMIDLPAPLRWLVLNVCILPFRPKQSAHAYQKVWLEEGSPLVVYSEQLATHLENHMGEEYQVELAMRYGKPNIEHGLQKLLTNGCEKIKIVPLFPQYSSAASGSAIAKVCDILQNYWNIPAVEFCGDFHQHPAFIQAYADVISDTIKDSNFDTVLFSFHGLPERHLDKQDCSKQHCPRSQACPKDLHSNYYCYRRQSYQTARLLADKLNLPDDKYVVSFQSRLGKTPWIKPYTDFLLPELRKQGIKNIAIVCPSFVTDCLETLEEIGIRAREQWQQLGGETFSLVPCLNADKRWVRALASMIESVQ